MALHPCNFHFNRTGAHLLSYKKWQGYSTCSCKQPLGTGVPRKSCNLLKRRLKIADLVEQKGEIKVDDLSALLGVSGVTIRGDLSYLEQQGYLKRSFGGAIATPGVVQPLATSERVQALQPLTLAASVAMARACAARVQPHDTLFLGHGELCRKVIPLLSDIEGLRLVVNDLQHALLAGQFIDGDVIVVGNELLRGESMLYGEGFDSAIKQQPLQHAIFESQIIDNAVSTDRPLLAPHYHYCLARAQCVTALVVPVLEAFTPGGQFGQLNQFTTLIASLPESERYRQHFSDAGFNVDRSNGACSTWSQRNYSGI